jgi:hypothetical protein
MGFISSVVMFSYYSSLCGICPLAVNVVYGVVSSDSIVVTNELERMCKEMIAM